MKLPQSLLTKLSSSYNFMKGYYKLRTFFGPSKELYKKSLFDLYIRNNHFNKAQAMIDKIEPKSDKEKKQKHSRLATLYFRKGEYDEVTRQWDILANAYPHNPRFLLEKARILDFKGSKEEAKELYSQIILKFPQNEKAFIGLAKVYELSRDWWGSAQMWQKAVEISDKYRHKMSLLNALKQGGYKNHALKACDDLFNVQERQGENIKQKALIFSHFNLWDESLSQWNLFSRLYPNDPAPLIQKSRYLLNQGKFAEADQLIEDALRENPENRRLHKALIYSARKVENWKLYLKRVEDMLQRFPHSLSAMENKIMALNSLNLYTEASEALNQLLTFDNRPSYQAYRVDILLAQMKFPEALEELDKIILEHPDNLSLKIKKLSIMSSSNVPSVLKSSEDELRSLNEAYPMFVKFKVLYAKVLISNGKFEEASKVIDEINPRFDYDQEVLKLRAWNDYMIKDSIDLARSRWSLIDNNSYYRSLHATINLNYISDWELLVQNDDFVLFCTIKNELLRFPYFLDFYRRMGVTKFFVCDNNSDDGTTEYLKGQQDVYIFHTTDNYALSGCGMRWVNELVKEYTTPQNWCIFVDPDEFIVIPGSENDGLRPLLSYMEANGYESFFAFMLDMYAQSVGEESNYESGNPPLETCPFFDNKYVFQDSYQAPYKKVYGGFRSRLFSEKEGLTKTPIIRGGGHIRFVYSSHVITPASVCDVTGVLLHFKFLGNVRKVVDEAARSETRYKSGRRYVKYAEFYNQSSDQATYVNASTTKFKDANQLLELNLMKTTEEFEKFTKASAKPVC